MVSIFNQFFIKIENHQKKAAWVVKLVDTLDLKSSDCNGRTGSSPVPSTKKLIIN